MDSTGWQAEGKEHDKLATASDKIDFVTAAQLAASLLADCC
jgi:hypothetical protein